MTEPKQTLTLSTTSHDRPKVDIDGVAYEMRAPDEMPLAVYRRYLELATKLSSNTIEIEDLMEIVQDGVSLLMVDLPNAIKDKLSLDHHLEILRFFSRITNERTEKLGAESETNHSLPSPSPDSSASTGAA